MLESASSSRTRLNVDPTSIMNSDNEAPRLNIMKAATFVFGQVCGAGMLAIPQAVVDTGYTGPVILFLCGVISCYTGYLLGECWNILRERYPDYENERITDPYPTIAFRAGGNVAKYATRVCVYVTIFGTRAVYLLLISENISELIYELGNIEFSLCYILLIITALLIPPLWLGTPKDLWKAAVIAALTSLLVAFLIFFSLITAIPDNKNPKHSAPKLSGFFNAFGTIMFAYGATAVFPTIQVDMREPNKFPISAVIGTAVVIGVYLLVGVTGFWVLGDAMKPNILASLPAGWISYTVNIIMTLHLFVAYLIGNNPIAQAIEGFFGIPDKFCTERIFARTLLSLATLFVALTIPHFNVLLSLLGGSTNGLLTFVFPALFYYLISRQRAPSAGYEPLLFDGPNEETSGRRNSKTDVFRREQDDNSPREWKQVKIPIYINVILLAIMLIGVIGGASSTYFAFASLFNGDSGFTAPCYVNISVGMPN